MDNVAWLYGQIVRFQIPDDDNILEYLKKEYALYFDRIYGEALRKEYWGYFGFRGNKESKTFECGTYDGSLHANIEWADFDISAYYSSWQLLGDSPEFYESGKYVGSRCASAWDDYGCNEVGEKHEMSKMKFSKNHIYRGGD